MGGNAGSKMETSCGFILVNFDSVLLLQYPQGHWSFPKGHVEEGDRDHHDTASRELVEETGIQAFSIDDSWSSRTEYTFKRRGSSIPKQVFWYIAHTEEIDVSLSVEHTNYLCMDFDSAQSMVTFEQEKELLRSARMHIQQTGKAV